MALFIMYIDSACTLFLSVYSTPSKVKYIFKYAVLLYLSDYIDYLSGITCSPLQFQLLRITSKTREMLHVLQEKSLGTRLKFKLFNIYRP